MAEKKGMNRGSFIKQGISLLGIGGFAGALTKTKSAKKQLCWQIDPDKCIQCGRCATDCVINPSAVKCVHTYGICGYCELCFGYFRPGKNDLTTGAENQTCPTDAIERKFVEEPFYEYNINEKLCIGCGKCVKGCAAFGNGALYLQVRHDLCLNCNECAIARNCPSEAFVRVPSDKPYILR